MTFGQWAPRHRRSILFLCGVLAGAGIIAALRLPVSLFPRIDFPRVVLSLDAADQPAPQMELLITRPVEEALRGVPGLMSIRSTTSRGSAEISMSFDWGLDMASTALQVTAAVSQILPELPAATKLRVRRMDPTVFPIIAYSLTSATESQTRLHDLAQLQLRPLLSRVSGVSIVQVLGGDEAEYRVTVDPGKLQAFGMALADVPAALAANNVLTAVGRLEDHYKLYLIVNDTRFHDLEQIRQAVLRSGADGVVRIRDIASVEQSVVPKWIRVTADGRDSVLLTIHQQPGSNSVQIAADVKAAFEAFRPQLPAGVKIANWYDQSELVVAAAASVRDAMIIGVVLAALVLLLFLRSLKTTLIAVLVVPAVLAISVLVLKLLGMSFNIMTLGGMAAAVGLIIDDAIVMIEQIVRRLRGHTADTARTVLSAAQEFFRPLAGSSAATIVIFLPLAFLDGVTGAFFKPLSITMASSLLVSFLISWLVVPLLASRFLDERDADQSEGGRLGAWIYRRYERLLGFLLAKPLYLLVGIVPLLIAGWFAYQAVGSGFMPAMDEGGFVLDYRSPPGTALSETDRLVRQVEAIVAATPEVDTYSRRTGTQLGGGLTEANTGDFFIRLKSGPRRPISEVMADVRSRVARQVPGLDVDMAQLMEDLIGDLTEVPQPIEIKLFADDPSILPALARSVASRIEHIDGVVGVRDGINPAGDALQIHIDRVKAALEGSDPDAITRVLATYLSGTVATQLENGVKLTGVRVWVPGSIRDKDSDLGKLLIRAPDGHRFPLGRVATVDAVSGQPEITRENLKQMIAVTARIAGRDLGSTVRDARRILDTPGAMPKGAYYELGGLYLQQQIAFHGLLMVFAAASALVFFVLLLLYESFLLAISILATAFLAVSAVFIGLWLTGVELNITAIMGMTMIIGIVTEVAIFYFSEQRDLAESLPAEKAMIQAGVNRMRPIAMTTIAAMLTLMPLAFAFGAGSEMQQPLAIAIISGLAVQLPLVLVAMPVIYSLLRGRRRPPPG